MRVFLLAKTPTIQANRLASGHESRDLQRGLVHGAFLAQIRLKFLAVARDDGGPAGIVVRVMELERVAQDGIAPVHFDDEFAGGGFGRCAPALVGHADAWVDGVLAGFGG